MADFEYRAKDDMFFVSGKIDGRSDLAALASYTKTPVRINFRETTALTSLGMKMVRDLIHARPDGAVEFHECPPYLVDMLNIIPNLIDVDGHRVHVRSVYVPFRCQDCSLDVDALVRTDEVKKKGHELAVPAKRCQKCARAMGMEVDPHDYFIFLG